MRRETKQREAILRILRNTKSHPTADGIYEEVKKEIPNISKGTVYRNLTVLQENGQVSELNLNGAVSRFEAKRENHYHFRCERCGRVFDVDEPVDRALDRKVAKKTGLKISYHQLEFRGLCHDCLHEQRQRREYYGSKKAGEKYRCNICGNEVIVTKVGGRSLVCSGKDMEKIER